MDIRENRIKDTLLGSIFFTEKETLEVDWDAVFDYQSQLEEDHRENDAERLKSIRDL